jgi:hypothetical protein
MISGLSPGGLSSVAPSGIVPEGDDESESVVPNGEVIPMPGVGLPCAPAAATLASNAIADKMYMPRIEVHLSCLVLVDNRQSQSRQASAIGAGGVRSAHLKPASFQLVPAPDRRRYRPACVGGDLISPSDYKSFLRREASQDRVRCRNLTKISHFDFAAPRFAPRCPGRVDVVETWNAPGDFSIYRLRKAS